MKMASGRLPGTMALPMERGKSATLPHPPRLEDGIMRDHV